MLKIYALLSSVLFIVLLAENPALCQESMASGEFEAANSRIHEAAIRGTVAFLASDELGGRGTPSPGFTIASAYVKSRFEGAGLQPAGENGTWFQNKEISIVRTSLEGAFVRAGDFNCRILGVLSAGTEDFDFQGKLTAVDFKSRDDFPAVSGPVTGTLELPSAPQRFMNPFIRKVNQMAAAGATAVIVTAERDHVICEFARRMSSKGSVANSRMQFPVPVIIVADPVDPGIESSVAIPAAMESTAVVRNVIGCLPGSDPLMKEEAILFTAHLDHLGEEGSVEGDGIYNGADDDASGVTAVLTLADAYAALPERPARSVLFMTLWGEEQGLLGSTQWAERPTWPFEKVIANINIEMIGRPEAGARGKIWMTGWSESDLGSLMHNAVSENGGVIFEHPELSAMLYRASDNWSFAQKGMIAHSFSGGSLHRDYHQVTDHWELLDTAHMTDVIRTLFHGSLPLAEGIVTPRKSETRRNE